MYLSLVNASKQLYLSLFFIIDGRVSREILTLSLGLLELFYIDICDPEVSMFLIFITLSETVAL